MSTPDTKAASKIIDAALNASTVADADAVSEMIEKSVGERHEQPIGDRWNNHGLMAPSGASFEYKALEPVTNQQDAVLERLAVQKHGSVEAVPYSSPQAAATDLLGALSYQEQADHVTVELRDSDPPAKKSKRLSIVYRDLGCGMEADQVPRTIFALGSSHKSEARWQQGAFGLGGASTFRNARRVILVSRRAPEMASGADHITVAVVEWIEHGKGQSAVYLGTRPWTPGSSAEPWSAPAEACPGFDPGTHLALVSYGVEGFHRSRSGDEGSFDTVLNTRLYRPTVPVRFTNNILRGKNEYLRGLDSRLARNPSKDRLEDEDEMLFTFAGKSYPLRIRYHVFPVGDKGSRRRFVARNHAVVFTSNGQVHSHWEPQEFKRRTELNKLHERIFVEAQTDGLPIELRTRLFTPDRSELLANEEALQLEDQVADFIGTWDKLVEINEDLVREAVSASTSGQSGIEVARKIAAALKAKGFVLGGKGSAGGGSGTGGPRRRRKVPTFPDPTKLEGQDRYVLAQGKVRRFKYVLDAHDDFLDEGRGTLRFRCTHPDIDTAGGILVNKLRGGYVGIQVHVPEGAEEGVFELEAYLEGWEKKAGGIGPRLETTAKLEIVDEIAPPTPGPGSGSGGQGAQGGSNVAVIWADPNGWEELHNGTPGLVAPIAAQTLAETKDEYKPLAQLGEQLIPTVVLNETYKPFRDYIGARAKALTSGGVQGNKDRYAVGVGLGLLILNEESERLSKNGGSGIDPETETAARAAVARSVLSMLPAFDGLLKDAGLLDD